MNTRQEHQEEPERSEGLGKRVRRFVDNELSRFLEKDPPADDEGRGGHPRRTDPTDRGTAPGSDHESGPDHEPDLADLPDPVNLPESGPQRVGLLNDVTSLRAEWQRVQGTFVDDPQRAVQEASTLVDRTLEEIRANVASGHTSETMSTEDLRVSFQRYREFFQRLLSA
ncbi:MAG: hypothetical protein ACRDS1_11835 [Pseudonocardiaceae bacterium]